MSRYFIEVSYKGTRYSGFQIQNNAPTIQHELEKALSTFYKATISLTGSSRTDAGVHALQNFFHLDTELYISSDHVYNLNAILPADISVTSIRQVRGEAHCRFDATARTYKYYIYNKKNPFLTDAAWYYPYQISMNLLEECASLLIGEHNFEGFSKRNTQVHTHICTIAKANWVREKETLVFTVEGNRFLRGMVRALVATQLKVSRQHIGIEYFKSILANQSETSADFSAPGHGLFLTEVTYPSEIFL